jgi:hypothetical protein
MKEWESDKVIDLKFSNAQTARQARWKLALSQVRNVHPSWFDGLFVCLRRFNHGDH